MFGSGIKVVGFVATSFTVTIVVAVKLPSTVVAVIVTLPSAIAVIKPEELTVAIVELLELQVTCGFVALLGFTVAFNCCVSPISKDTVEGLVVTPVTLISVVNGFQHIAVLRA